MLWLYEWKFTSFALYSISWQVQNALDHDPNELDGIVPAINDLLHSFSTWYSLFWFRNYSPFLLKFLSFSTVDIISGWVQPKSMWGLEQEWKSLNFQFVTSNEAINVGRKISNKHIRTEDFYGLGGKQQNRMHGKKGQRISFCSISENDAIVNCRANFLGFVFHSICSELRIERLRGATWHATTKNMVATFENTAGRIVEDGNSLYLYVLHFSRRFLEQWTVMLSFLLPYSLNACTCTVNNIILNKKIASFSHFLTRFDAFWLKLNEIQLFLPVQMFFNRSWRHLWR